MTEKSKQIADEIVKNFGYYKWIEGIDPNYEEYFFYDNTYNVVVNKDGIAAYNVLQDGDKFEFAYIDKQEIPYFLKFMESLNMNE